MTGTLEPVTMDTPLPESSAEKEKAVRDERYTVGKKVLYLPHICHSLNCDHNNEYPWVIGIKQNPRLEKNPETGELETVEEVVEVDESKLSRTVLPSVINAPNPKEQHQKIVPLRPRKPWPAVIIATNKDNTLDLDILSNVGSGMVTLQYRHVPIDETRSKPHSCYAVKE